MKRIRKLTFKHGTIRLVKVLGPVVVTSEFMVAVQRRANRVRRDIADNLAMAMFPRIDLTGRPIMLRQTITFWISPARLRKAVQAKATYHGHKAGEWERKLVAAQKRAKRSLRMVKVPRQNQALSTAMHDEMQYSPVAQLAVTEAQRHVDTHQAKREEFAQWLTSLEYYSQKGDPIGLHHDDLVYFGLSA